MNYKIIGSTFLATSVLLGACGNNDDTKKEEKSTTETKKSVKKEDNKKKESSKAEKAKEQIKQSKENKDDSNNTVKEITSIDEKQTAEVENIVQPTDINNITTRAELEKVIYGNYSEIDKITAYNNAVQNGIIPQGNVMEGPASKAYESSLRIESGQEKSVYDNSPTSETTNSESSQYDTTDMNEARANIDLQYQRGEITKEQYDQWVQEIESYISSQNQ